MTSCKTQAQIVGDGEFLPCQEGILLQVSGQKFSDGVLGVRHSQAVQHLVNLVKEAAALLVEAVREASCQISEKVCLALYLFARGDDQSCLLHIFVDHRHLQLGLGPAHIGGVQSQGDWGGRGDRGVLVGGDIERAVLGEERQDVLQGERRLSHGALDHQAGAGVFSLACKDDSGYPWPGATKQICPDPKHSSCKSWDSWTSRKLGGKICQELGHKVPGAPPCMELHSQE